MPAYLHIHLALHLFFWLSSACCSATKQQLQSQPNKLLQEQPNKLLQEQPNKPLQKKTQKKKQKKRLQSQPSQQPQKNQPNKRLQNQPNQPLQKKRKKRRRKKSNKQLQNQPSKKHQQHPLQHTAYNPRPHYLLTNDISSIYDIEQICFNPTVESTTHKQFLRQKNAYISYQIDTKSCKFLLLTEQIVQGTNLKPKTTFLPRYERIRSKEVFTLQKEQTDQIYTLKHLLQFSSLTQTITNRRFHLSELDELHQFFHLVSPWSTRNYLIKFTCLHPFLETKNPQNIKYLFVKPDKNRSLFYCVDHSSTYNSAY